MVENKQHRSGQVVSSFFKDPHIQINSLHMDQSICCLLDNELSEAGHYGLCISHLHVSQYNVKNMQTYCILKIHYFQENTQKKIQLL